MRSKYSLSPISTLEWEGIDITSFVEQQQTENIDWKTVHSFGNEWTKFHSFSEEEIENIGGEYFDIVDCDNIRDYYVLDVGCGTGRWSKYVSKRVGFVEAVDPSDAVFAAARLLKGEKNVRITQAEADNLPFEDETFDFVFSLGVLHHVPDTSKALISCVKKLKTGGNFLVYLYYSLDNRGPLYRFIFKLSNLLRDIISNLPQRIKAVVCDVLAVVIYLPLIALVRLFRFVFPKKKWYTYLPLAFYIDKTFNVIRSDTLDRFGTPLEHRFSKEEIRKMMEEAGLENIIFSENAPYWHAKGQKK